MAGPRYLARRAREHLEAARRDYGLYRRLLASDEPDWALVVLFYSALHLVQAHAEHTVAQPGGLPAPLDHESRDEYLRTRLASLRTNYRTLAQASKDARYDLVERSRAEVEDFYRQEYQRIRAALAKQGVAW